MEDLEAIDLLDFAAATLDYVSSCYLRKLITI